MAEANWENYMRHLWTSEAIENQAQASAFLADCHAKN